MIDQDREDRAVELLTKMETAMGIGVVAILVATVTFIAFVALSSVGFDGEATAALYGTAISVVVLLIAGVWYWRADVAFRRLYDRD